MIADTGLIFIRLAAVAYQTGEITRKFRQNWTLQQFKVIQGHRSWCQSKVHINFLLATNIKFGRISHRFRDIEAKSYRKWLIFPPHTLV